MTADLSSLSLTDLLAAEPATIEAACELSVFGDNLTANTDERIIAALETADIIRWVPWYDRFDWDKTEMRPRIRFWERRLGQPWQAALEAHVAAYRAAPRPFLSDWNATWLIVERLKELAHAEIAERDPRAINRQPWTRPPFILFAAWAGEHNAGKCFWNLSRRSVVEAALRATWKGE